MKKILSILMVAVMLVTFSNTKVFAENEGDGNQNTSEVYVDDTYYTLGHDMIEGAKTLRTRGKCTDRYSWDWCVAHGYYNRPVGNPVSIQLTKKEIKCLVNLGIDLASWGITAVSSGGATLYFAPVAIAVKLWNCLF
ncbi:MAG: hypothetical protein SPI63_04415 [Bulleidia sp.]|nr:hypothetical protein [Bulleidia sp.]